MLHVEYTWVHILTIYTSHVSRGICVRAYPNNLHITCFTRNTRHNVGLANIPTTLQYMLTSLTNSFIYIEDLVSISHQIFYVEIWCQWSIRSVCQSSGRILVNTLRIHLPVSLNLTLAGEFSYTHQPFVFLINNTQLGKFLQVNHGALLRSLLLRVSHICLLYC